MPRRCRCRNCRPTHRQGSSDSGLTETEVCGQERTSQQGVLRQRHQLRRSQSDSQGANRSIREEQRGCRVVRSVVQGRLHLHTTQGTTLRRTVGSSREAGEAPTSTSGGQCTAHARGNANNARGGRGGAQQPAHSTAVSRPERRRCLNSSASSNRRGSAFAATRIRRRRQRQQAEVLEAMADAMRAQAEVLASLVQRLRPGVAGQRQVAPR
ncbi:uncharacterized protein LOC135950537 [Calliphora vicina]|uniref:uncharacterized protein LOC135950537 n=1 Tax=Calliphora vicina TaxID=7373 RepID=UPI00325B43D2